MARTVLNDPAAEQTTGKAPSDGEAREISPEQIAALLAEVLPLPKAWVLLIGLGTLLSTLEVSFGESAGVLVVFRVSAITAALLALVWLPALVRVIALGGGGIKTAVMEASSPGLGDIVRLLPVEAQRRALPSVVAALRLAEGNVPEEKEKRIRALRARLETRLRDLPADRESARERLRSLAREYERVRREMKPSAERTFQMERVVASARALAKAAEHSPDEIEQFFRSVEEGDRVIALALLQVGPTAHGFPIALEAFRDPKSQFEQYHALVAL